MLNSNQVQYAPKQYIKYLEKSDLKKTASGIGFFIFTYFGIMFLSQEILLIVSLFYTGGSVYNFTDPYVISYLNIFSSTLAPLVSAFFYSSLSKNRIGDVVLTKPVRAGILVPLIFIGMSVAMTANFATEIVSNNFSLFGIKSTANTDISATTLPLFLLECVGTALMPAVAEEFAFRGIVMGTLRKYGDSVAIILSAVMFGAMHCNIVQIPFAFILGLLFAYLDCKTNSILPSVIIHFLNNFYAIVISSLNRSDILDERGLNFIAGIIIAAFCILGIVSFFILVTKKSFDFSIDNSTNSIRGGSLSMKEKTVAAFTNPGIIFSISVFLLLTISMTGLQ